MSVTTRDSIQNYKGFVLIVEHICLLASRNSWRSRIWIIPIEHILIE